MSNKGNGGGLYQARRRRVEMNLLPLIDVLVMLIFFAFVTMQFRSVSALNVTLPKFETAGKNALTNSVEISISKTGEMLFNGTPTNENEIETMIRAQSEVDRTVTVMIRPDEDVPFRFPAMIMDLCRKHGLNTLKVQSR